MDLNNRECKGGDGFIDRSKVRILVCDSDSMSLKEVSTLLSECSYQVISVKSARQVIDALNAEGPDIDIILTEVDLPMAKGMKLLRYITRDKDLRRIPVIMMSRQDEVSVVVKCLKLGAADYLVKPLRTNELLNLWTHMWRRRRMLGLVEKNMLNYDFDLVGSDPSDANTNSTNLFSDDTDDKTLQCTNLQENECSIASVSFCDVGADATATSAPSLDSIDASTNIQEPTKRDNDAGQFSSGPKKNKLKIGESSAFFTYVKSTVLRTNCEDPPQVNQISSLRFVLEEKLQAATEENNSHEEDLHSGTSFPDSLERSCTPPSASMEFHNRNYQEENMNPGKESSQTGGGSRFSAQNGYPYYMQGMINQVMMPQYGQHFPHCPPNYHPNVMAYYHSMNTSMQHGQIPRAHQSWSPAGNPSSNDLNVNNVDRREEALLKFRRKRNQRCFDKKIRYVNRKRLAEARLRVKGQFVRNVNVDLNGQPDSASYDNVEEEEEEEEDPVSSPLEILGHRQL